MCDRQAACFDNVRYIPRLVMPEAIHEINAIFDGDRRRDVFGQIRVSVLKMFKAKSQALHLPVDPILILGGFDEAVEVGEQAGLDRVVVCSDLVFRNVELLRDRMQ